MSFLFISFLCVIFFLLFSRNSQGLFNGAKWGRPTVLNEFRPSGVDCFSNFLFVFISFLHVFYFESFFRLGDNGRWTCIYYL